MRRTRPTERATLLVVALLTPLVAHAQGRPTSVAATRAGVTELRAWDQQIDAMIRSRDLRVRLVERDTLMPDRQHERLDQYVRGVRVFGGDLTRQTSGDGTVSVFGVVHAGIDVRVTPRLGIEDARRAIAAAANGQILGGDPELLILPMSDGYHLAYFGQAAAPLEIVNVFVDANTGEILRRFSDFLSEGVVGGGKGTYGDAKKVSAMPLAGTFVADDGLRPAAITTYDMKGNLPRLTSILNRTATVAPSDIASDSDNDWTDATVVDAHVYAGLYYDYLFKRFGRRGLDNQNLRMPIFTHPVRIQDLPTAPAEVVGLYYLNAFYCPTCGPGGRGAITLGEGAPRGTYFATIDVKPFAAAFDVVAHELTHGLTANSARLNGFPFSEAGALNEAFSDIFGVSTAFFFQPTGSAPTNASYLLGRDLTVPPGLFGRAIANPRQTENPDHYTFRVIGTSPHYNSTIVSHAFYLAIEGGRNLTSGQTVQGVGAANREQIEKAFFRALTSLLPSAATFGLTRTATIQAARDLYGAGSAPERAITQAWDAVGVQERVAPTVAMLPDPSIGTNALCDGVRPSWILGITVSAGSSSLRITEWVFDGFDHTGAVTEHNVETPVRFAQFFGQCGPGSDRILAQTDACAAVCLNLAGDTSGSAQISLTATDDTGRTLTFASPRVSLQPPR